MIKKVKLSFIYSVLLILLLSVLLIRAQQNNPMDNQRWNKLDINKVATIFNNAECCVME